MKYWTLILLLAAFAGCSSEPSPELGGDVGVERDELGADAATETDLAGADLGADIEADIGALEGCAALSAAACFTDPGCTVRDGCVDASANDERFRYSLTGHWDVTVRSEGEKGLPSGDIPGSLALFRADDTAFRGVLLLPDHGVSHRVWGGVGPTGGLGVYLGPAECGDAVLCGVEFGPVYEAAGIAAETTLEFTDVRADSALVDFRTFVSLHATPSDGFKPVNPVQQRTDPFEAEWTGELVAVGLDGRPLELRCAITVSLDTDYVFRAFQCDPSDPASGLMSFTTPDDSSLAYANGKAWFALGASDDDLMLVGRTSAEGPWAGIVARRGDVWSAGEPLDPADVPMEHVRGTFKFFGWPVE